MLAILASCLNSLTPCGDKFCPPGKTCHVASGTCYGPDQLAACNGLPDDAACTIADLVGYCRDGICLAPRCGDGIVQGAVGEQCDEGAMNADVPDALCRTDCKLAICGDGIVDPGRGEVCDDGGATGTGDTCAADCGSTLTCGNGLVDLGEDCDDGNSTVRDGCSACRHEQLVDMQLTAFSPRSRFDAIFSYDAARDRAVVFGGKSPTGGNRADTWEWDGARWREVRTLTAPIGRSAAASAYDSTRMRIEMFGGVADNGMPFDELWEYDGANWLQLQADIKPPARSGHVMAYDAKRERLVLFGGTDAAGNLLGDTWEWDGTTWLPMTPATSPPPLTQAAMVYDPIHGEIVMFGGKSGAGPTQGTWTWDGSTWTDRTPQPITATSDPSARYGALMAFDVGNKNVILVYGHTDTTILRDYWLWDGTAWTQTTNLGTLPYSLVNKPSLGYDIAHGQLLYFYSTITRIRTGTGTFLGQPGQATPPARTHAAAAYDPVRGRMVLYGGGTADGASRDPTLVLPADTWEWDGSQWTVSTAAQVPTNPGPRRAAAMTYSVRDGIVLEGGSTNELWSWDGPPAQGFGGWTMLAGPPPGMPDRWAHAMVYDILHDRLIVTGGGVVFPDDQWEWNGTSWSATTPQPNVSYRWNMASAYDPRRHETLITGGQSGAFTSYEYDGVAWASVTSPASFARGCVMAYDPNRAVLEYLVDPDNVGMELWQWDGVTWTQLQPLPSLPPLYRPAVAFDAVHGELVMFGGRSSGSYLNTTRAIFYQPNVAPEVCTSNTIDYDHDGLAGCADPDCAARCEPLCLDGTCPAGAPKCGDGTCDPLEDCLLCPDDCHTGCPADACGDFRCTGAETAGTCPGDCG